MRGASTVLGGVCADLSQKCGKAALSYSTRSPIPESTPTTGSSIFMDLAGFPDLPERKNMGTKLEKLGAELAKARRKKAEWETRVKELERRYQQEENTEIHEMVHAANLTPDQLSQLLKRFAEQPLPDPDWMESLTGKEESTDEV